MRELSIRNPFVYLTALYLAVALAMTSCAGTNLTATIKTGYDTADIYTQQTTQLLQADLITSAEAQNRLDLIKQAHAGLDAAKAAAAQCQTSVTTPTACNNAQVAYDAANTVLNQVLAWLISHGKTGK